MKITKKQYIAKKWFIKLQNIICKNIEEIEETAASVIKIHEIFKKNV